MTSDTQAAVVYIYLPGDGYVPAGRIRYDAARESCMFRYGTKYVERSNAIPIDPVELPLNMAGEKHTPPGERLFTALRDGAPDHWGRKILSFMAEKHVQTLNEFDFLTAGFTENKIGALAFGPNPKSGPMSMASWFDKSGFERATADLDRIAKVVRAVDDAEDDELEELRKTLLNDEFMRALAMSPSIGGARPKCLLDCKDGNYIVKFSKSSDVWNEPVIEHATMELARLCGIDVARTFVRPLQSGHALFVKRFDRQSGKLCHFISGYTLGALQETGDWKSYQHLAQEARRYGDPFAGEQLFRRMVFNMLCSNIDDHPRNQAFFVFRNHVRLTPAYDIVPTSWERASYALALRCGSEGKEASLENALSDVAPFGLSQDKASKIVSELLETCALWPKLFANKGVAAKDIERLKGRFRLVK